MQIQNVSGIYILLIKQNITTDKRAIIFGKSITEVLQIAIKNI